MFGTGINRNESETGEFIGRKKAQNTLKRIGQECLFLRGLRFFAAIPPFNGLSERRRRTHALSLSGIGR